MTIIRSPSDIFHPDYNRVRWGQHLRCSSHSDTDSRICQSNTVIQCSAVECTELEVRAIVCVNFVQFDICTLFLVIFFSFLSSYVDLTFNY